MGGGGLGVKREEGWGRQGGEGERRRKERGGIQEGKVVFSVNEIR